MSNGSLIRCHSSPLWNSREFGASGLLAIYGLIHRYRFIAVCAAIKVAKSVRNNRDPETVIANPIKSQSSDVEPSGQKPIAN